MAAFTCVRRVEADVSLIETEGILDRRHHPHPRHDVRVKDPFRLDQGDVSFDSPDTVKAAMRRAIDDNHSHYLQTTGVPRLLELLAEKLRTQNGIPVGGPDEIDGDDRRHPRAVYIVCQALLEPGDEVIVPDPEWPPCDGQHQAGRRRAGAVPAARVARLALRPRRARVEDHAEDARDLHQLAAQSDRRRADARRRRGALRRWPQSTGSG